MHAPDALPALSPDQRRSELARLIAGLAAGELLRAVRDLGGHDLSDLLAAFAQADAVIAPTPTDCYDCTRARAEIEALRGNWSAAANWFADATRQARNTCRVNNPKASGVKADRFAVEMP